VYGEPRLTQDIDVVIAPDVSQLDQLCAAFPDNDFYVSKEAAREALNRRGQFNVLDPSSGNKIDFMIAGSDAWGLEQLKRREHLKLLPDFEGFAARPEDVIISKMLYYQEGGSEKHLRDIAGMMKMSGARIDQTYIQKWAQDLELMEIWNAVIARLET
jgi:hypothetical protein